MNTFSGRGGKIGWQPLLCLMLLTALFSGGCGEEPPPDTRITIDSQPVQDCEVIINGESRGNTPVTIEGLAPGSVDVVLKREGYKRSFDRIVVRTGVPETFTLEIEPLVGFVTFESEPEGAEVLLDGESIGKTPIPRLPVAIGDHEYAMSLPNHNEVTGEVSVLEDFEYNQKHKLEPMEAVLSLASRPTGATIWLNNRVQQERTPARFVLPAGTYVVAVHTAGYIRQEERIELAPKADESLVLRMKEGEVPPGMVLVPGGEFIMGSEGRAPDERPKRKLSLPTYYIDKYEVTNREYKEVFPAHVVPVGMEEFPVTGISWNQANEYARAVGKRLPTEAEWEKAARGESGFEYPWGDEFDPKRCNSAESKENAPVRVGLYLDGGSPYGCMDMAGNVYEWVSDLYAPYPGNTDVTVEYGQIFRVLRGGSYETEEYEVRTATRHFDKIDSGKQDYGFRCVMDPE